MLPLNRVYGFSKAEVMADEINIGHAGWPGLCH